MKYVLMSWHLAFKNCKKSSWRTNKMRADLPPSLILSVDKKGLVLEGLKKEKYMSMCHLENTNCLNIGNQQRWLFLPDVSSLADFIFINIIQKLISA